MYEATNKGTPQKVGTKMIVLEDGSSFGTIGGGRNEHEAIGECLEAIQTGEAKRVTYNYVGGAGYSVCGGQIKVFIDPYNKTRDKGKENIGSLG
ncbi:MAG: XdhC family protein [Candidatus Omnitrophica bacterium]|nr:XdhC family protein [Chlamydiia bacterium]MCB9719811.1 XdhC family protein [Candidatus Omnitrophota bacterium]